MLGFGGAQNATIGKGQLAVCATTNPQIVAKAPVVEVVLTLITRFGVGRSFILLITSGTQQLMSLFKDIPQRVIIR
ncbi:hypothetical protein D3C72_2160730 [compost metagenome]